VLAAATMARAPASVVAACSSMHADRGRAFVLEPVVDPCPLAVACDGRPSPTVFSASRS